MKKFFLTLIFFVLCVAGGSIYLSQNYLKPYLQENAQAYSASTSMSFGRGYEEESRCTVCDFSRLARDEFVFELVKIKSGQVESLLAVDSKELVADFQKMSFHTLVSGQNKTLSVNTLGPTSFKELKNFRFKSTDILESIVEGVQKTTGFDKEFVATGLYVHPHQTLNRGVLSDYSVAELKMYSHQNAGATFIVLRVTPRNS